MMHLDAAATIGLLLAVPFVLNAVVCVRLSLGRVRG